MSGSGGLGAVVLGLVLLAVGAVGASLVHRTAGRPTPLRVLALAPFGVLIGAGAALVRGWDLLAAVAAAAVLVPLVGVGGDVLAARRRARAGHRPGAS
jgi:hypothetical protein